MVKQIDNKLAQIADALRQSCIIEKCRFSIGDYLNAYKPDFDDTDWKCAEIPVHASRDQGTTWFRFHVTIPDKIMGIDLEGSSVLLTYRFLSPTEIYIDGKLSAAERTWIDYHFPEVYLTENALPGQVFTVAVKLVLGENCYWTQAFTMGLLFDRVDDALFQIESFRVELRRAAKFQRASEILPGIYDCLSTFLNASVSDINQLLNKINECRVLMKPFEAEAKSQTVHMIGHAHIDMSWFWDYAETLDVVERDFKTMLEIIREEEGFKFSQSQAAAYEMAEMHFPDIFSGIKQHTGKSWDVTAAMWVESDLNMASGESIVRQILYGKRYIKDKFGADPRVMWCPDTFGHPASIPQIAKKSGLDYYFLMRSGRGDGRNIIETYEIDTPAFWWEGIDGSRILAYEQPYNNVSPKANQIAAVSDGLRKKFGLSDSMFVYGVGDHGGGPTRRSIRRIRELDTFPAMPRVQFADTQFFYERVKKSGNALPIIKDEMNFVYDGCYTSHADIKKINRLYENKLYSAEIITSLYGCHDGESQNIISKAWKNMLFNQFHDILCGACITSVYTAAKKVAAEDFNKLSQVSNDALERICRNIELEKPGEAFALFNPTCRERGECVKFLFEASGLQYVLADSEGRVSPTQTCDDGIYAFVPAIPPMGYKTVYLSETSAKPDFKPIHEEKRVAFGEVIHTFLNVETAYYYAKINSASGEISTLYDRVNNRYIVRAEDIEWYRRTGVLNTLAVYEELPRPSSAWNIAPAGKIVQLVENAEVSIKTDGAVVKIIQVIHKYHGSVFTQDICFYNDSPRIDFITHIEWNECAEPGKLSPMLKAVFVPDIDPVNTTYEIPFGTLKRPCKDIEVPALRWMDISDNDYGVSVLNDCKYGHKVLGNRMELTLIRTSAHPDRRPDTGPHDFTYSLLPHAGGCESASTAAESANINVPLLIRSVNDSSCGDSPDIYSFLSISNPCVAVSALKRAENGEGLILRAYEMFGRETHTTIKPGFTIIRVLETDLLENEIEELHIIDNYFVACFKPFEIKTFRLLYKDGLYELIR